MTLNDSDTQRIYELRQKGRTISSLAKQLDIDKSIIKYLIRLIDRYGIAIIRKSKTEYQKQKGLSPVQYRTKSLQ